MIYVDLPRTRELDKGALIFWCSVIVIVGVAFWIIHDIQSHHLGYTFAHRRSFPYFVTYLAWRLRCSMATERRRKFEAHVLRPKSKETPA